jgi:endonuclease YncB( thermonuclease family)
MDEARQRFSEVAWNVPEFSLAGWRGWARVVSIYDADTITVVMPIAGTYHRVSLRIKGIDASEIKSKSAEVKALAFRARNRIYELCTGQVWGARDAIVAKSILDGELRKDVHVVWIECDTFDKYGRVLATVRCSEDGRSFADVLVSERLAYVYAGGSKLSESEQAQKMI